MPAQIAPESPLSADGQALIAGSQQALDAVFPPDEIFTMSPAELDRPEIAFLVAREDGNALGCVALVDCGDYAEVKRLYVADAARGRGLARDLMAAVEDRARARGHRAVLLETGEALVAAAALYRALGYRKRGPFGDYADHPASLFMEKAL